MIEMMCIQDYWVEGYRSKTPFNWIRYSAYSWSTMMYAYSGVSHMAACWKWGGGGVGTTDKVVGALEVCFTRSCCQRQLYNKRDNILQRLFNTCCHWVSTKLVCLFVATRGFFFLSSTPAISLSLPHNVHTHHATRASTALTSLATALVRHGKRDSTTRLAQTILDSNRDTTLWIGYRVIWTMVCLYHGFARESAGGALVRTRHDSHACTCHAYRMACATLVPYRSTVLSHVSTGYWPTMRDSTFSQLARHP